MFQFGGAWSFIWGVSPQNPPRGDGLLLHWRDEYICFTPSCAPTFCNKIALMLVQHLLPKRNSQSWDPNRKSIGNPALTHIC